MRLVPQADLAQVLPFATPFLKRALRRQGDDLYTVRDVVDALTLATHYQLWIGVRCAAVTYVQLHPRGKVCTVWLAAGDRDELFNFEPQVGAWAKSLGCIGLEAHGRIGWLRNAPIKALGYKIKCVVMQRRL
jgi:hypothetical protein